MQLLLPLITLAVFFSPGVLANWCCCAKDHNSQDCCKQVTHSDTFYAPSCGLINGQTCDLGGDESKQMEYKQCCEHREGASSGACW
ncbi:hypothetical protein B0J17DRAFT_225311 [Rhizoctonia solani]|nr:hypothetical protein B0J17DRAFT_225311 [Rhizoctonia solani]